MRICITLLIVLLVSRLWGEPELRPIAAGQKAGEEWTNGLNFTFCWCPGGDEVGLEKGFWLGKYEVTKGEFDLVTPKKPRGALATESSHPRDAIRHDDILQFVDELNRRERFNKRLPEGWAYALPTEQEWEYACRAGAESVFSFGDDLASLSVHGNFADRKLFETGDDRYRHAHRSLDDGEAFLAKVGTYRPNPWGFHDMHGNLWEWTASLDGAGDPIARGGSWVSRSDYCESGFRRSFPVVTEKSFIGFRLALKRVEVVSGTESAGDGR